MFPVRSLLLLICALLIYDTEAEDQVRLVGGRTPFEGRVEVTKDDGDTWGTVCDDQFDVNDAKVVCRMLGFTNTEYARVIESSNYGVGSGVILFDDTKCQGNESSIFHCNHTTSSDCDHTEDVGISCQTPVRLQGPRNHAGRVEIQTSSNGSWSPVCYNAIDENAGKVLCRMLALSTGKVKLSNVTLDIGSVIGKQWKCNGTEADIQNCIPSSKSCTSSLVAELECSTSIRLQNGSNIQSGRVEVFHQGDWGTVCDDSFDDRAASVVCRMLDFSPRQAIALAGSAFGEGTGKKIVDELQCTGEEDDISDCKSKTWGSPNNCQHTEDASVECGTLIRLSDGPLKWSGRLEIKSNGIWMAVCDPTFDDNDAFVVCSMLGYHGGTPRSRTHAYYGSGTGAHFDYNRQCYGNETDIIKCTEIRASSNCNHSDDVGVNCFSDTPIRFEGGTTPGSGRVEVYDGNKGLWKGVCNAKYGFTQNDAKVLCKMIGHPNENPRILDGSHYHYVIRGEGIAHLNCSGTELDISDCRSSEQLRNATCDYPDYIGINCDPVTAVRLVDGPSRYAGRVEILFNESWGGICSNSFNDFSSDVNCKMVHKSYVSARFLNGYYQQTDNVIINDLHCIGTEADVSDCKASPWTTGTCSSTEADSVVCESNVRLVNGSSERSGIVEVFVDDDWRTICAKDFDHNAADVVCRMSGFKLWNVSVLAGSVSDHLPYLDNIKCNGTESSLAICISGPWNKTTCEDNLVATIDCNIWHTTMRLLNGENPYSGRIEVFYDNRWGTVCGDSFSQKNAEVVCRTLGYNFSTDCSVHIRDYGYLYNNVMISELSCDGREVDVSLCTSDDWDTGSSKCGSTYYHSVGVNCLTQTRLVGGTRYMGRVEIQHQNSWGSVCNEKFLKTNIPVLCSMMGFNFTDEYQMIDDVFYTSNTPYPFIENLQCIGEEIDIQQCKSSTWGSVKNCTLTNVAAISCHTPVRLSNGSNIRTGQVEVFKYGRWVSLVYQSYSLERLNAGKVICRMLGLSTGSVKTFQIPGNHSNCMNVTCTGVEEDLALCKTETITSAYQGMSSLGVTCDTGVSLINGRTPYMGAVQINLMDRWGIIQYFQSKDAARIVCLSLGYDFTNFSTVQGRSDLRTRSSCKYMNIERLICNGNETDVMECTKSYRNWGQYSSSCYSLYQGVNCQTQVRLSQSFYQHGQVEMQYNKEWHPICSNQFGIEEAHVVCRMLGHYHVENTTIVTYNNETGNFVSGMFSCNGSEVDISQCSTDWQTTNCTDGKAVHVDCRSSVRLVDGPTKYKGRVEVFYKGKWGPICAINSRVSGNAKVVCKALGFNYNAATFTHHSKYSNATFYASDFTITKLQCVGSEEDITECVSNVWNLEACSNSEPLEIECNTQVWLYSGSNSNIGHVRISYNDTYSTVCGDNFTEADATTVCRNAGRDTNQSAIIYTGNKFGRYGDNVVDELGCIGLEKDIQECYPTPWFKHDTKCNTTNTAVSVNCRPKTPIRLVGTAGMIEIHYSYWGRICNYGFDLKDASVVCNMLGYKVGKVGEAQYGGPAIINELRCQGIENDISECTTRSTWSYDRSCPGGGKQMASVECSNNRVRLMGGVNDYCGRVEFNFIGTWGIVCDTNFDSNDAEVVCRQIGLESNKNAKIYNASRFGYYSTHLVVDNLKCNGSETDLDECESFPWSTDISTCEEHTRGVGVNCRPHTPIRLVNGTSQYTGRVEIEYKGSYGTICDREFDLNDAKVVCRNLGYNPWSASFEHHAYYGPGSGNIIISHLRCTGDEPDISECHTPYRWETPYEYCYHGQDVSVQCDTPVRLHGGWTEFDGKVEVYINQTWKPVCKNEFTQNDARTICKIKKFWNNYPLPITVSIKEESYYNKLNDEHTEAVGKLNCKGDERDLFACGNEWITETYSDCSTVEINCRPITPVRLMTYLKESERGNGKASMTGRVEIMYKDTWGSICDDQFGDEDALVLCRMLNFTVGYVVRVSSYGKSAGPILLDDLRCLGTEEDISDCMAREWGTHNCDHDEDVVISCDYQENIDPCSPRQHTWLPNLELRYANVDTTTLPRAINDSKLPLRWYNVGNNTLPTKEPARNHCGTYIPLYSTDSTREDGKLSDVKVSAAGYSDNLFEVQMKYCNNIEGQEFYVYRLGPTGNDSMGYCFGEGSNISAPSFVPDSVTVVSKTMETSNNNTDLPPMCRNGTILSFVCKFEPSVEPLFYQVTWTVEGNSKVVINKKYFNTTHLEKLELTETDFYNHSIGLGVNVFCSVRAFRQPNGQAGPMSPSSKPYFVGLQIKTPTITLRNGETKSILLEKTFPITCKCQSLCAIKLRYSTPDDNTCTGGLAFNDDCGTKIESNQQYIYVNISTAETGQFAVGGHFKVYLSADADENVKLLDGVKYKLPAINVNVLPETNQEARMKVCSARNDPHMHTFDGKQYEHHDDIGEYILYRHREYDVEVQHKISHCTDSSNKAKCNCGVAVRAGQDVYVINVCDHLLDIGYRHCGDSALTVKKDNDFTYAIYLPYGTGIKVRIDNAPYSGHEGGKIVDISVLPSVKDQDGNSTGLCGTLNEDLTDDFHDRNLKPASNRTHFISSWRVQVGESLFSKDVDNMQLKQWLFPTCGCRYTDSNSGNEYKPFSCDRSVTTCTQGTITGHHSCGDVSPRRTTRSLRRRSRIPVVMQTDHYAVINKRMKREANSTTFTNESATRHCEEYFKNLKAFELCSKVPATHTNISVDNCILDILLTHDTIWTKISQQSMQDACMTQIHRNATVRQDILEKAKNKSEQVNTGTQYITTVAPAKVIEIEEIEQTIADIKKLACLNDCSGHGNCSKGDCICDVDFGASDCSLDIKKPPRVSGILDHGQCDESNSDCTHIYVFGEVFVGTNLTCRLQKFKMGVNASVQVNTEVHEIPGIADTLIEAMCPVQQLNQRRKRSTKVPTEQPPEDFVHGYKVTISNDGENFSDEEYDVYVYDSTCQAFQNQTGVGVSFSLTPGYCHIEGKCIANGSLHMSQKMTCDTSKAYFTWTNVPTTTVIPATQTQSTPPSIPGTNCQCEMKNTQSCAGDECVCKPEWTGETCNEDVDECKQEPDMCQTTQHLVCQNQLGSYQCVCARGYQDVDGVDSVCTVIEKNSTTVLTELIESNPTLQAFHVEITLDIKIDSSHSLESEQTYTDVKTALKNYYTKKLGELGLKDIVILSLRKGSMIVEHYVIVEKEEYEITNLAVALADMSLDGQIYVFGNNYAVTNVKLEENSGQGTRDKYHDFLLCESYIHLHPCAEQHTCAVVNDKPTCKKVDGNKNTSGDKSLMIIIGSSVGGALFLIILVLICVVFRNKKQIQKIKKQPTTHATQNIYNDMDKTEMTELQRRKWASGENSQKGAENKGFKHETSSMAESTGNRSQVVRDGKFHPSSDGHIYYYGKG